MHGFPRAVAAVVALLALSVPAQAERWVASWTGAAHGPYPLGNPTAQPELKFAFRAPEQGASDHLQMGVAADDGDAAARNVVTGDGEDMTNSQFVTMHDHATGFLVALGGFRAVGLVQIGV